METKWLSLVSYGLTVDALTDFLPLDVTLDVKTVRHDPLKVAERCEAELGEEQGSFIEGCPRGTGSVEWERLCLLKQSFIPFESGKLGVSHLLHMTSLARDPGS
jgi:hypothetical protein